MRRQGERGAWAVRWGVAAGLLLAVTTTAFAEATPTEAATDQAPKAYVTFAITVHDWRHMDEGADTLRRAVGIYTKHGVRGEVFLSGPVVSVLAAKRRDVLSLLRQTKQTIGYHVTPPHPICTGFDQRLRALDARSLGSTLRHYETFRLDPVTGEFDRSTMGGYVYVARTLGLKPVAIDLPAAEPSVRSAALDLYRQLGAKAVIEDGAEQTETQERTPSQQGLVVCRSDLSVSRWTPPGGKREAFWWEAVNGEDGDLYEPVEYLKSQVARWKGPRPPLVSVRIHGNDFSRDGPVSWHSTYYAEGPTPRPLTPPFDLNAPDRSRLRPLKHRERIWKAYEDLVAYAAANLKVVTSEDIVTMAKPEVPAAPAK